MMGNLNFEAAIQRIDSLMNKGSENVSNEELAEIRELALVIQEYEQNEYAVDPPNTLIGMIEMKVYEYKLK